MTTRSLVQTVARWAVLDVPLHQHLPARCAVRAGDRKTEFIVGDGRTEHSIDIETVEARHIGCHRPRRTESAVGRFPRSPSERRRSSAFASLRSNSRFGCDGSVRNADMRPPFVTAPVRIVGLKEGCGLRPTIARMGPSLPADRGRSDAHKVTVVRFRDGVN